MIKVGKMAPDFNLKGYFKNDFKDYGLKDYKDKWLVVVFYPADFTFICPTEVTALSKSYVEFQKLNAEVVGVSVDSVYVHKAWEEKIGELQYPLLSDFMHQMSKDYEVFIEEEGVALRGTFIIDPNGMLKYCVVSSNSVGRSVPETLRVLQALQTGELCPIDWHKGDKTLGKA